MAEELGEDILHHAPEPAGVCALVLERADDVVVGQPRQVGVPASLHGRQARAEPVQGHPRREKALRAVLRDAGLEQQDAPSTTITPPDRVPYRDGSFSAPNLADELGRRSRPLWYNRIRRTGHVDDRIEPRAAAPRRAGGW